MILEGLLLVAATAAIVVACCARRCAKKLASQLGAATDVFELAHDPVLVADILEGRVLAANSAACALLGYSRDELVMRRLPDLHPEEHRAESAAIVADVWHQQGLVYRLPLLAKDGTVVPVEESASLFRFEGRPSVLIHARDIRRRLQLEAQLVQSEKMAALGNLVAGVAHDINTPVGSIHANAATSKRALAIVCEGFARHGLADALSADRRMRRALAILEDNNDVNRLATERIVDTVRALKNFARLDEAERQRVNVHEGLDDTLRLLRHELLDRATVVRRYGDLPELECFPNQLNQAFMNILVNAVQACDGHIAITITTALLDDGSVQMAFADTGCGISSDDLPRVFDPGFTRKGVGVGSGLGLSICYQIIARHQGTIEVESELGRGTTITITLPATAPPLSRAA